MQGLGAPCAFGSAAPLHAWPLPRKSCHDCRRFTLGLGEPCHGSHSCLAAQTHWPRGSPSAHAHDKQGNKTVRVRGERPVGAANFRQPYIQPCHADPTPSRESALHPQTLCKLPHMAGGTGAPSGTHPLA